MSEFENPSVAQLKQLIVDGWELWYCAYPGCQLPGHWELRRGREKSRRICWDVILRLRKHSLPWFKENTVEEEIGRDWCYRFRQAALPMAI